MRTAFAYDPIFLRHDTGDHPENAGRLQAITRQLEQSADYEALVHRAARPAGIEEIGTVHAPDYIRQVEEAAEAGMPFLGTPDCVLSRETYRAACAAAGALIDATVDVAEGRLDNAFVVCRPPGHHAERDQALGFCFFNNVAIAAEVLVQRLGFERVLIFDFDVHHGNGTQHHFQERRDVMYASMHQDPRTLFPGTGFAEERGGGEGRGYTLNVPMPPLSGDEAYLAQFERVLLPAFREYRPQFVLLSAGYDAHREDPLANENLTQFGFDLIMAGMKRLAHEQCRSRMVAVLEGGYHYRRLAECVASHISQLQADPE